MKKVGIDLTWVRHQKVGGTESCVRNLLSGIETLQNSVFKIYLILSKDNEKYFDTYSAECFEKIVCNVYSSNQIKRVIWQNFNIGQIIKQYEINVILEPIYSIPFIGINKCKVIATIHDLQAIHYPEYFSIARVHWMKFNWKHSIKNADKIIAISNYVKHDIIENFNVDSEKIEVIYDAIDINKKEYASSDKLKNYGIKEKMYYYTVSSLLPHKNLKTLVLALAELKKTNSKAFYPLVISGVGGKSKDKLYELAKKNGVEKEIIITSYVNDLERNMLYKYCKLFLFPSIFEGFGMPPLEAMAYGSPVLTTKMTSIYEVTDGKLNYVNDPVDYLEWARVIESCPEALGAEEANNILNRYSKNKIASQYIKLFTEV